MMVEFQPPRDRDACNAIRGYVYQIDRTVARWLELQAGQVLELERGEDIDVVRQHVSNSGSVDEHRLLEQIKHCESSVTLRSRAALESLANFHAHRIANPDIDLSFCFLTNATIGLERLNRFPNGIPGIILWEQVRTGQLTDDEAVAAAGLLCRFLSHGAQPAGLAEDVWTNWNEYVATTSPEAFRNFIQRFEWSTDEAGAKQLPVILQARIIDLGFASNEVEAAAIADRLFVHVTRLLGTKATKQLTVEERGQVLNAPTLPESDRQLLAQLRNIVAQHSDRLDQLESEMSVVGHRLETLYFASAKDQRVELGVPAPELSVPLPVARLSSRSESAEQLCRVLTASGWLALHGGPDVGKSQLAIQVVAAHDQCRGWVRFHHGQKATEACRHLEHAMAMLAGFPHVPHRNGWYAEALEAVGGGSLVVLDDLPRVSGDEPFAERLVRLGQAAQTAGACILSTSRFELPVRLRHHLGTWLDDRPAPAFTDDEAAELFRAHGAPDSFLSEQRQRILNLHAAGHPLLLTATAEFLASRGWSYREEEIDSLLRHDHAQCILPEVVDRLTRTLDEPPRELLYRLTLPIASFDGDDVSALAGVPPAVDRPRERLNAILGAWVQRDTDTRFAVSPLVKLFGGGELAAEVRTRCYRELADRITCSGKMNLLDGERAILYNLNADEFGRAITLYVLLLIEAQKAHTEHVIPYIDKWRKTVLPSELTVGNRLLVRAYQLAAFTSYGLDTAFLVDDIDNLLAQATVSDGWGIVALAGQSLSHFRIRAPERVLRYVRRAVELPVIYGQDGREITFDSISIAEMLWILVTDLRTPALLRHWLDAVASLPAQHRVRFWECDVGQQGVRLVANAVYLAEWEKPEGEQDWEGLLQQLSEIRDSVESLRQPRLESALTGVMLEILGDRKWLNRAATVAEITLSRWPDDPDVQFKVRGTWGRQCTSQDPDEALALLKRALFQPHSQNDHERLRCLMAANVCVKPRDLRYIEEARDIARHSADAPDMEAARALGEYALSLFQVQDGKAGAVTAFTVWSEAVDRFLEIPRKDKIWRRYFPLFAHVTSYLMSISRDGTPPEDAGDGSPGVIPMRGFLLKDYSPEREELCAEGGDAAVMLMMGMYAAAAGSREVGARWMKRSVEESRRTGAIFIQVASGYDAIADMVAGDQFEQAAEMGVFVGRGRVVHHALATKNDGDFEGTGVDVMSEFRKLPQSQRQMGDGFAVIAGMIPVAMGLVRLSLADGSAAVEAGQSVAHFCRELANDEAAEHELWNTAAELFELSSVERTNSRQIAARSQTIEGESEQAVALRVLGYVLATWHASPHQAMGFQLCVIELLLQWTSNDHSTRRRVLTPYIESYWRHAAQQCRFAFRTPNLTVPALEAALDAPERERIHAVLSAAVRGFRLPRDLHEVLQRVRNSVS